MNRGKLRKGAVLTIALLWLVFAVFYLFNTFERVENLLYDKIHQKVSPVDSRVVIIGIDDESIKNIGRWPWSRSVMADVVDILTEGGAAAVGIDILFDTPSSESEDDEYFAKALERSKSVVLAVSGMFKGRRTENLSRADELITPIDELLGHAARLGHVNGLTASDGVIRRALLSLDYGENTYKSLAYEVYDLYKENNNAVENIPVNSAGQYYINFTGRAGWYHPISFSDVYEKKVPPGYFKDKLVLIGLYAQGITRDWQFTAIDGTWPTYGVEIHANILQQLLEEKYIKSLNKWLGFGIFVIFSLVSALFIWKKPKFGLILLLILFAVYFGVIYLISNAGYVTQITCAPVFCLLAYFVALIWHYTQTRINEARVRSTFGKYMAPTVIKKILEEGEAGLRLGGQRRSVTILFVDIRGFTPLSEMAQPEEIVQILNEYLDLTASCIHKHGGTLDKFIGDAAMGIWGAPYDMPGHTIAAVNAAVDMRSGSAELERKVFEKYGKTVRFGVGINSGDAIIGNIGATFRMDYTAIGDTVNTASRLESNANPGQILLSKAAAENIAGENITLNALGAYKIKGKQEELQVYEVANP